MVVPKQNALVPVATKEGALSSEMVPVTTKRMDIVQCRNENLGRETSLLERLLNAVVAIVGYLCWTIVILLFILANIGAGLSAWAPWILAIRIRESRNSRKF